MSLAYYNEHDSYAAHWLRNLIAAGLIAPGVVDERDIRDVRPEELIGFTQVHMFAGIGVWSHALRSAGWSDDRPIWTGSCPCQPFSAAGRAGGIADERHLWPHWHWLIEQCRPAVVLGEQVASKDGLGWFDLVSADLEGSGYAVGASDLCAAGIGVDWQASQSGQWLRRAIHDCVDPVVRSMLCDFADWAGEGNISEGGNHIRQRLYFVGLENAQLSAQSRQRSISRSNLSEQETARFTGGRLADRLGLSDGPDSGLLRSETVVRVGDSSRPRLSEQRRESRISRKPNGSSERQGAERTDASTSRMADGVGHRRVGRRTGEEGDQSRAVERSERLCNVVGTDAANRGRYAKDWLFCRDDRWRAAQPGSQPLAHGVAARVGKLRAFGNALDAETATRFCEVVKEICDA